MVREAIRRSGRIYVLVVAAASAAAVAPTAAGAHLITIGSPLTAEFHPAAFPTAGTYFNSALPEPGADVVSPVEGAILRFNLRFVEGGPYRMRVLSPEGGSVYRATGSTPEATFGGEEPHFHNLRIKAGDSIGIDIPADGKLGVADVSQEGAWSAWAPPLGDGAALPYTHTKTERELAFNAVVLPVPTVSKVVQRHSYYRSPGRVEIHGSDFQYVSKVSFGSAPAHRFRVASEHLIVAVPFPSRHPLRSHVHVRTLAGTSATSPASAFKLSATKH